MEVKHLKIATVVMIDIFLVLVLAKGIQATIIKNVNRALAQVQQCTCEHR